MRPVDLFRLFVLAAIWGGSFLFMRVTVPVLGAVPTAFGRVALAAAGLLVLVSIMRVRWNFNGLFKQTVFLGLINSGIPFLMFAFAAQVLPAGYSAILNATVPLMAIVIGSTFFGERVGGIKLAGVALGLAGVAILTGAGPLALTPVVLAGVGACLIATACYGFAGFLTRRWITQRGGLDSRLVALGSQTGAVFFMGACLVWQLVTTPVAMPVVNANVWLALLALGLVCTSFAYILYFQLLSDIGPMKAMMVTFLIPVFGVLWGWLLLDEKLSLAHAIGGGLVAVAIWLVAKPERPRITA
ncbi:EamA family transporter [Pigmentiphaga aceris]|uniref:EamA family transporter n=1 Tax=Pigmentiphaga aceris TaxID=1940612 RepID=A0A5C0AYT0_9BURK|nr:DMT family transporter [Pigmentiphaga aceris]QEI07612.1 EamA family transporter [Pigmentiphaga aceris]